MHVGRMDRSHHDIDTDSHNTTQSQLRVPTSSTIQPLQTAVAIIHNNAALFIGSQMGSKKESFRNGTIQL